MTEETVQLEKARKIFRDAGALMVAQGVTAPDVALGLVYASLDWAETFAGEGVGAIEWLRTACDVMERRAMSDNPRGG